MRSSRPIRCSPNLSGAWIVLVCVLLAASCTIPRRYQANKPFVFKTNIDVQGTVESSDNTDIELRLANQLDDSLKPRVVSFAGIRRTLIKPPVFDTSYANRSVLFMNALLNSLGYYQARITWDSTLRVMGKQQRVTVNFKVVPGKNLKTDSIGFALTDTALQRLALANTKNTLLKKNQPYSQTTVAAELDRLVGVFKDNGYLKMSREDIYAEVDTVVAALINPTLDPFEQLRLLQEVQRRREHPAINVTIKQRVKENSPSLKQYRIGRVRIYPDLQLFEDTLAGRPDSMTIRNIQVYTRTDQFKRHFLVSQNSLIPGELYRQRNYYKTVNTFSQLGAWQQVNVEMNPNDSLGIVDVNINLYPSPKLNLMIDLEATRNTADIIAISSLFGVGVNTGLTNVNVAKESIRSTTNARGGVELGTRTNLIQTLQGSLSQNYYFPRFITPFRIRNTETFNASRTILNVTASYTDRRNFFTLGSLNGSIGYQWTKRNKVFFYSPLNIELFKVGLTDSLNKLFNNAPNLRFSFNDGLVITQNFVFTSLLSRGRKLTRFKARVEESGAISGLVPYLDRKVGLFRYVKSDVEYTHLISNKSSAWAFRLFGGIGVPYGKQRNGQTEPTLPFSKAYFAGGANSMRAWQIRRLGPGSGYTTDSLQKYDRFADISLEGNIEYRFNLVSFGTMKVKSAFFTDVGNIWNRKPSANSSLGSTEIKLDRFYQDVAVAAGTSLRFDFSYFLVRFDWAYKVKNPIYSYENAGWFHHLKLGEGQFQLGIGAPF